MIIKFFKALWEWLSKIRGYLSFDKYTGSYEQQQEIAVKQRLIGGKPMQQRCKVCGDNFWAMKHNPTCAKTSCFFKYRIGNHPKYAVTTKHQGIERNHTVHAHSMHEVLRAGLPGKIKQISKVK